MQVIIYALASLAPMGASAGYDYDPIGLAIEQLALAGMPPPDGYTIRAAGEGQLPPTQLASTDSGAKTIDVDLGKLAGELNDSAEGGVQEFVDLVASILAHEYGHTGAYGTPSIPPATGFNNDLCSHQSLYGNAIDRLCELIEQRQSSGGTTKTLCKLNRTWCGVHNGIWCIPPACGACS